MELNYNNQAIIEDLFGEQAAERYRLACVNNNRQVVRNMECAIIGYKAGAALQHHEGSDGGINVTAMFKNAIKV